jgi:hypothetical protein
MDASLAKTIKDVEEQYRRVFLSQLEKLLNNDGAYLSFVGGMAAIDALACFYGGAERKGSYFRNEEMFRKFVADFFPPPYGQGLNLWDLRNSLLHRFVVHKDFILNFDDPTIHTKRHGANIVGLEAKKFWTDLTAAADGYFTRLRAEPDLQSNFQKVCQEFGVFAPEVKILSSGTTGTASSSYGTTS